MKKIISLLLIMFPLTAFASGGEHNPYIVKANINLEDTVSLQRGAQIFMNNCNGCHSLKYLRFSVVAEKLGISEELMQENLMFTTDKLGDQMITAMDQKDAKNWFGAAPPDLTTETRLRGPDWVYSYLTGFYPEAERPYGYNNHVLENASMPHVLAPMQAAMSEEEFEGAMLDLTNFLAFSAEPTLLRREELGKYVLIFLFLLLIPVYLMKQEYWKDVH